ncbi:hypothetical protein Tco_1224274 [Tanacetum coccineum]
MEDELRHLRLKDHDIAAYTSRFNELVLLCPDFVPSTEKKISQYIKGLPSYIQGETYSSKPTTLNEAIRMAHGLMEHKIQGWNERNAEQNKRKWEGGNQGNNQGNRNNNQNVCGDPNHLANSDLCPERKKQGGRNTRSDKSFINASLTHLFDIEPERISTSYEVELADRRIVKLGTFDVIIGMDWLVALDAVIVCVISYTKARKYIEIGCHLFLAHVTEKEKSKKRLKDVLVIRDFPEVFPNDLSGLPPSRQVEFKIDLVSGTAPVARAPYRLAPSEMNCLNN